MGTKFSLLGIGFLICGFATQLFIQGVPDEWKPSMLLLALVLYILGVAIILVAGWRTRDVIRRKLPRLILEWPHSEHTSQDGASTVVTSAQSSSKSDFDWGFERHKGYYFVGMSALDGRIIIHQFQAQGHNRTADPIVQARGYIRSDKTNKAYPILFNLGGKLHSSDEIDPIPVGAIIDTRAYFSDDEKPIALKTFLADLVPFTFFFEYDGKTYRRTFVIEEIEPLIREYEDEVRKTLVTAPRMSALRADGKTAVLPRPDYDKWDKGASFRLFELAYLFEDVEPAGYELPPAIRRRFDSLCTAIKERRLGILSNEDIRETIAAAYDEVHHGWPMKANPNWEVSRQDALTYARGLNIKPPFLFPRERVK